MEGVVFLYRVVPDRDEGRSNFLKILNALCIVCGTRLSRRSWIFSTVNHNWCEINFLLYSARCEAYSFMTHLFKTKLPI